MGFFIRPKGANRDGTTGMFVAEAIGVVDSYEDEYIPTSGFNPADNTSGAEHRRDPVRREAPSNYPLPTGGKPAGISGGARGWRGPVSKTVPSGFGRGTRAGNVGVRRG